MKKKMIWVAGILIATSAYAQTDVSTGIMRGKDYGVTYLLPKTEIEIVVQATKHTYLSLIHIYPVLLLLHQPDGHWLRHGLFRLVRQE